MFLSNMSWRFDNIFFQPKYFSPEGEERKSDSKVIYCTCNKSNRMPFCDGAHKLPWYKLSLQQNARGLMGGAQFCGFPTLQRQNNAAARAQARGAPFTASRSSSQWGPGSSAFSFTRRSRTRTTTTSAGGRCCIAACPAADRSRSAGQAAMIFAVTCVGFLWPGVATVGRPPRRGERPRGGPRPLCLRDRTHGGIPRARRAPLCLAGGRRPARADRAVPASDANTGPTAQAAGLAPRGT